MPAPRSYYQENHTSKVLAKFRKGKYKQRNDVLFDMLKPHLGTEVRVADLAAGSSYLAKRFLSLTNIISYTWNDFNPNLVEIIRQELKHPKISITDFDLESTDIDLSSFDVVICVSLEHIENDIALIEQVSSGATVAIGSPNFGGIEHVRFFNSIEEFTARYSPQIDIVRFEVLNFGQQKKYILVGNRR